MPPIPLRAQKKVVSKTTQKEGGREIAASRKLELDHSKKLYKFWIKYFTKRERPRFIRHMANGREYWPVVRKIFKEHGLPQDLFFVGLIESGFNNHIRSRAQAVGPWQFIKGTATRYGLRVNRSIDERSNILKATHAAARYFKDLYNIFGSWELALCAYNAGEYRIINAIRRGNTRDYRQLVKKRLLPKETIYYIPKVVAARDLFSRPTRYGLPKRKAKNSRAYLNVSSVNLKRSFNVKKVRRKFGISKRKFEMLNPDLKHRVISASRRRPVTIYLPSHVKVASNVIESDVVAEKRSAPSKRRVYLVRRGDSLFKVARKFKTTVSKIKKANKLRRSKIYVGQRLKLPSTHSVYIVRRGDTLSRIARKFGTSIKTLVAYNSLNRRGHIFKGQKILIPDNL